MRRPVWRIAATILILIGTITAFIYYFVTHESVRQQLSRTSPTALAVILLFYFGTVFALAMINESTLRLCKIKMGASESLLITSYSSVVNFFGPLQSGPAFRAVYLKKKFGLNLKNYTAATFMYYFFYAAFSGLFLLSGLLKWWLAALAISGLVFMAIAHNNRRIKPWLDKLDIKSWYWLAAATFLQLSFVTIVYYTELHSVAPQTSLSQAIIYTGAANFALFVSITPGAIGFRETFLLFSQRLHHISSSTIVAANIIDRAMYITLLLLMALFIFGTHARRQLQNVVNE